MTAEEALRAKQVRVVRQYATMPLEGIFDVRGYSRELVIPGQSTRILRKLKLVGQNITRDSECFWIDIDNLELVK